MPSASQHYATTNLLSAFLSYSGYFIWMESDNRWPLESVFFHWASCFQGSSIVATSVSILLLKLLIAFRYMDTPHFIYPLFNWQTLVFFYSGLLWIILLWPFIYRLLFEHVFNSLGICLGAEFLSHMAILYLAFWRTTTLFSIMPSLIYISTSSVWRFQSLHIFTKNCLFSFLKKIWPS